MTLTITEDRAIDTVGRKAEEIQRHDNFYDPIALMR